MAQSSKPNTKNVISAADRAILREKYEFVPSEDKKSSSWQDRMVERYHDGLYKEYALADLSRPGQIGLRWRSRQEVLTGRGDRTCGNKRCLNADGLVCLEVPFAYVEAGVKKKELVKLKLCPTCKPLVRSSNKQDSKEEVTAKASSRSRRREHEPGESSSLSSYETPEGRDSSSKRERRQRKRRRKSKDRRKSKKR